MTEEEAMEQLEAMRRQERTAAYRCRDYLGMRPDSDSACERDGPSEDDGQPAPATAADSGEEESSSLRVHRAALEECARFIDSLAVQVGDEDDDSNPSRSRSDDESRGSRSDGRTDRTIKKADDLPFSSGRRSPASVASPLPPSRAAAAPLPRRTPPRKHRRDNSDVSQQTPLPALARWRRQMCEWCYATVDTFGMDRECVSLAFSYLDRYFSAEHEAGIDVAKAIDKDEFQLLSMTALYVAVKVLQPDLKLSPEALVDMSQGQFEERDFREAEVDMLRTLQWRMNPPTPLAFANAFVQTIPAPAVQRQVLLRRCRAFSEAAVLDPRLVSCSPSSVALASVIMALEEAISQGYQTPSFVPRDALDCFVSTMKTGSSQSQDMHLCMDQLELFCVQSDFQ